MAKRAGLRLSDCNCTSLLGYPDDDLNSFFRIYVAILKFGAMPAPFPVYLFPGSPDYKKYRGLIKHKDLSELHGQLWPLLPERDADKYTSLFKFIKLTKPAGVKENLGLLSADLKAVLLRELETSGKFIDLCLNAKKDTLDEFRKIERELTVKKPRRTRNILYIVANPSPLEKSASRQLGEHFLSTYIKASPRAKVTVLDLCEEGLPFINREYVDLVYYKEAPGALSAETKKLVTLAEKYIGQLREADEVVIVSPMYTLSVPAILKAYLELVASRLFYFYDRKMLDPKPVVCILTRDGVYPPGGRVFAAGYPYMNVQEVLLTAAVSFLGLSDNIKFITASGGGDKERLRQTVLEARREIEAYVAGRTLSPAGPGKRPE